MARGPMVKHVAHLQRERSSVQGILSLDTDFGTFRCLKLSGEILKALSSKCFRLTSLNIAGCPKMNDMAIRILSKKCHYLHFLDVSGCVHLTDKAIEYILEGCKQLHVLKMWYCRRISKVADFRISSRVKYREYSIEDPPFWFGYDCKGAIFHDRVRVLNGRRRKSSLEGSEGIENTFKNQSSTLQVSSKIKE